VNVSSAAVLPFPIALAAQPVGLGLRPYQNEAIDQLRAAVGGGRRRALLVAPTGSGKTLIAAALVRRAFDRGRRVLFLAHRRELVAQAHAKLHAAGIDAGIIQAGYEPRLEQPVQIASVATLWARAYRSSRIKPPPADLLIVDEAHHVRARTWMGILQSYPEAAVLGLTATPCRGDGRGLGDVFEALVECPPVADLIKLGFLVPTRVYAPSTPDLTGVRVERGDYAEAELAERMDTATLVGDIVEHWHRLAERRKTVVFATGVEHSVHLRDEFCRSGVIAEHIDGKTPAEERDAILARLSRGETEVVCNCMVLVEGWDQPAVSCIILARPTKHMGLYRQMIGRVLRPASGKQHALVLDHAGLTWQHGLVEEPVIWTLDQDRRAENPLQAARSQHKAPGLTTCPECSAIRTSGQPCPACGWQPTRRAQDVEVADGELAHVDASKRSRPHDWTSAQRASFHRQLLWIANERGYKPGWAAHKYRERFGMWPSARHARPEPPDDATKSWVRSRQIAYAKALRSA
jgi:DNA repair protein RadD